MASSSGQAASTHTTSTVPASIRSLTGYESLDPQILEDYGILIKPFVDPVATIWKRRHIRRLDSDQASMLTAHQLDVVDCSIDQIAFDRMQPALRVASLLLLRFEFFFAKIYLADLKSYKDPGLFEWQFLDSDSRYEPLQLAEWRNLVRVLHTKIHIFMGRHWDHPFEGEHGFHGFAKSTLWDNLEECGSDVWLNHKFLDFFSDPDFDSFPKPLVDRISLSLLVTLLHELAHAIWQLRVQKNSDEAKKGSVSSVAKIRMGEPCFSDPQPEMELGRSLEHAIFGYILEADSPQGFRCAYTETDKTIAATWRDIKFRKTWEAAANFRIIDETVVATLLEPAHWPEFDEEGISKGGSAQLVEYAKEEAPWYALSLKSTAEKARHPNVPPILRFFRDPEETHRARDW